MKDHSALRNPLLKYQNTEHRKSKFFTYLCTTAKIIKSVEVYVG